MAVGVVGFQHPGQLLGFEVIAYVCIYIYIFVYIYILGVLQGIFSGYLQGATFVGI